MSRITLPSKYGRGNGGYQFFPYGFSGRSAGGGPVQLLLDEFTGVAQSALDGRTPDSSATGGTWTDPYNAYRLEDDGTLYGVENYSTATSAQIAEIGFVLPNQVNSRTYNLESWVGVSLGISGVGVRWRLSSGSGYSIRLLGSFSGGAVSIGIYSVVAGVYTTVVSPVYVPAIAQRTMAKVKIIDDGTSIKVYCDGTAEPTTEIIDFATASFFGNGDVNLDLKNSQTITGYNNYIGRIEAVEE